MVSPLLPLAILSWALAVPFAGAAETLFFLAGSKAGGCSAKTLELPSKQETVLFTSEACPSAVVWEPAGRKLLTIEGAVLRSRPAKGGKDVSRELAKLPRAGAELWIDGPSGRPRIAYLVPVKPEDAVGDTFKFEGRAYATGELPEWGSPSIAVAEELSEDNRWKRLEAAATKDEAGDTPGLRVLKTYAGRKAAGWSLDDLLRRSTCAGGLLECAPERPEAEIKALFAGSSGDAYGVAKGPDSSLFVFNVIFGDTAHAAPPVFFCKGSCKAAVPLKEVTSRQLSIAVAGQYALVSTEYDSTDARIYDATTGALLHALPDAASTVWLPSN